MTGRGVPIDQVSRTDHERYRARVRGCLLGGAIGDAVGAPVEFASLAEILERCGPDGVRSYVAEQVDGATAYAALCHPGPTQVREALTLAVTHSGDSDSTGAICGNILGTLHGDTALPPELVFPVEGRGTILQLADDLALEFTRHHSLHGSGGPRTGWERLYPGV